MIEAIIAVIALIVAAFFGGKVTGKRTENKRAVSQDKAKALEIRKGVYDVENNHDFSGVDDSELDRQLHKARNRDAN